MSQTVQEFGLAVAQEWERLFNASPELYSGLVAKSITNRLEKELQEVAAARLKEKFGEMLDELADTTLTGWIKNHELVAGGPSQKIRDIIEARMSSLMRDVDALQNAADRKKIAVFQMVRDGVEIADISKTLCITERSALEILKRAKMDLARAKKVCADYDAARKLVEEMQQ